MKTDHVVKPAPQGKEKEEAGRRLIAFLEKLDARPEPDLSDEEWDALVTDACDRVRHGPQ